MDRISACASLHITFHHITLPGLLSSHGSMSLERLHTMLKLVAGGSGSGGAGNLLSGEARYDFSLVQLRQFLQGLADQYKLECLDGMYSLCK